MGFPLSTSSWADMKPETAALSPAASVKLGNHLQSLISPVPVTPESHSKASTDLFSPFSCTTPMSPWNRFNEPSPGRFSLTDTMLCDGTPELHEPTPSRRWQQLNSDVLEMSRAIAMLSEAKERQGRHLQRLKAHMPNESRDKLCSRDIYVQ